MRTGTMVHNLCMVLTADSLMGTRTILCAKDSSTKLVNICSTNRTFGSCGCTTLWDLDVISSARSAGTSLNNTIGSRKSHTIGSLVVNNVSKSNGSKADCTSSGFTTNAVGVLLIGQVSDSIKDGSGTCLWEGIGGNIASGACKVLQATWWATHVGVILTTVKLGDKDVPLSGGRGSSNQKVDIMAVAAGINNH